ncbi:hypothetical protein [Streptomyces thinghirensis]|uniref:Alpha/beta hydrolase n=1 Tax=Streptomyces thinghirensis TaxID=551547 RepID=A0ABP9T5T6_9ACTN
MYEAAEKITMEQVRGVDVPAFLGVGGRETGPAAQALPLTAAALPDAHIIEYPELGHLGPLEDCTLVAKDALRHFAGILPGGS